MIGKVIERLTPHISVIKGHTNIGVCFAKAENGFCDVYIIDSGGSKEDGKQIFLDINEFCKKEFSLECRLKAVLVTHAHADHCGGNAWLKENAKSKIWVSAFESAGLQDQRIESSIFCGTVPVPQMHTEFYVAVNTKADRILSDGEDIRLGMVNVKPIDLPGHSLGPLGFLITDVETWESVFFLGDCVFGRKTMGRYWIPFIYDVESFKKSLNKICTIKSDYYIPSHGDVTTTIDAVAELNLLAIMETEEAILKILQEPKNQIEVIKAVGDINGLDMPLNQYLMIGSTIRSFLNCLCKAGQVFIEMHSNVLYYKKSPF